MPSDVMQKPGLLAELALALRDIGEMHPDAVCVEHFCAKLALAL